MGRLVTCLLLAALCRAGEGDSKAQAERVDALVERFCDGDPLERRAARSELVRLGRGIWPRFRALIDHSDPDVRLRARAVWVRIILGGERGWATPGPKTTYDPKTGFPLHVIDRKAGVEFRLLEPGTVSVDGRRIVLAKALYFGVCEVTQESYGRGRPDVMFFHSRERGRLPVTDLALADIKAFLNATGTRLPTEAEWEYAFHAGGPQEPPTTKEAIPAPDCPPNRLGIRGLRGNVAEWCLGADGTPGLLLGGSFSNGALRVVAGPGERGKQVGFRVVRAP